MEDTSAIPAPAPLPGETPRAFAAFRAWQDLGPSRSLPLLAEHLGEPLDTLKRWSSRHRWARRLTDLAAAQWQQQVDAAGAAATPAAADWAARTEAFREQQWLIAQQLLAAARCFLESFGESQLERMTLSQVSRAIHISSLLARHAVQPGEGLAPPALSRLQLDLLAALDRAYGPPGAAPGSPALAEPSAAAPHRGDVRSEPPATPLN
jgi:hypothetical protein